MIIYNIHTSLLEVYFGRSLINSASPPARSFLAATSAGATRLRCAHKVRSFGFRAKHSTCLRRNGSNWRCCAHLVLSGALLPYRRRVGGCSSSAWLWCQWCIIKAIVAVERFGQGNFGAWWRLIVTGEGIRLRQSLVCCQVIVSGGSCLSRWGRSGGFLAKWVNFLGQIVSGRAPWALIRRCCRAVSVRRAPLRWWCSTCSCGLSRLQRLWCFWYKTPAILLLLRLRFRRLVILIKPTSWWLILLLRSADRCRSSDRWLIIFRWGVSGL
jgi:hypothetical protein